MILALPPALATALLAQPGDGTPLALADLPEYRAALEADPSAPAQPVRFRDLWNHPDAYRGHRVEIEGRLVRRFHQEAVGTYPALAEAWVFSDRDDPFCVIYPDPPQTKQAPLGASVRFRGTFLKQVRYQAGDGDRLAPLIVGQGAPKVVARPNPARPSGSSAATDWTFAAILAGLVILFLTLQHLRRPARRPERAEPPPVFEDWNTPPAEFPHDGPPGSGIKS
jgi:hypothetical protein